MTELFLAILTILSGAGVAAIIDMSRTLGRIEGSIASLEIRLSSLGG